MGVIVSAGLVVIWVYLHEGINIIFGALIN